MKRLNGGIIMLRKSKKILALISCLLIICSIAVCTIPAATTSIKLSGNKGPVISNGIKGNNISFSINNAQNSRQVRFTPYWGSKSFEVIVSPSGHWDHTYYENPAVMCSMKLEGNTSYSTGYYANASMSVW